MTSNIIWHFIEDSSRQQEEGLKISFPLSSRKQHYHKRPALKTVAERLTSQEVSWITPGNREWIVDLDKMNLGFPGRQYVDWFRGKTLVEPEIENEEKIILGKPQYVTTVALYITPDELRRPGEPTAALAGSTEVPAGIQMSLERFREDHPDSAKVAFVMMQFGRTRAHEGIVEAIRKGLAPFNITAVRADDKEYHEDLFPNVRTYLHGCGFGVAVFERIEAEDFNPNVSLEVGYLLAMGKPVCLLKDRTLKTLHTDLVSRLYRTFDPFNPMETIPPEISRWLSDRKLV
jgi:hypothetical protein